MGKRIKMAAGLWLAIILVLACLGTLPCQATVPGDIAAGLPLERVIANGLGAGMSSETVLRQALDAGAEHCPLIKAALANGIDLTRIFKILMDRCQTDVKFAEVCAPCTMMKCAVDDGKDKVEVANAMMAAGASLEQVRACLGTGFETYTYTPPAAPGAPVGFGPTFPGGGGGGGVASPSS